MDISFEGKSPNTATNNENSFASWVGENYQPLVAAAEVKVRQMTGYPNGQLADEVVTNALAIALGYVRDGELVQRMGKARSLQTWLMGVIRNEIREACRQMGRFSRAPFDVDVMVDEIRTDDHETQMDAPVIIAKVRECLGLLTEKEEQIWSVMVFMDGERPPSREMADMLGTSSGSVDVHVHNGRTKLQECLTRKGVTL